MWGDSYSDDSLSHRGDDDLSDNLEGFKEEGKIEEVTSPKFGTLQSKLDESQ